MALYVVIGYDGEQGLERRKRWREDHLRGLEPLAAARRIRHAGPLLDPAGQPIGSLILFEAPSLDDARSLAAADPYVMHGVFERYEVRETKVVFPR